MSKPQATEEGAAFRAYLDFHMARENSDLEYRDGAYESLLRVANREG